MTKIELMKIVKRQGVDILTLTEMGKQFIIVMDDLQNRITELEKLHIEDDGK